MDIRHLKSQAGLTLMELMIAMAIFGILMAGMVQILTTNNKTYRVQEQTAVMQQNVRVAKLFIERDLRMAGCGLKNFSHEDDRVYALSFTNGGGENNSDLITINYIDYGETSCGDVLEDLTMEAEMPANSSESTVEEEMGDAPYSDWDTGFTCDSVDYAGTPFKEFKAIITSPDGSQSDVVFVTSVQNTGGSDKIQNRPYGGFTNKVLNTYPAGSTLNFFDERQLVEISYQLDGNVLERKKTDAAATSSSFQPVAENVEDLQFAFGLDTDSDGDIDPPWINNANLTDTQKTQVRAVRFTLLGRSRGTHPGKLDTRPAIEDNPAATDSDTYIRKQLQVTVKVRNLG